MLELSTPCTHEKLTYWCSIYRSASHPSIGSCGAKPVAYGCQIVQQNMRSDSGQVHEDLQFDTGDIFPAGSPQLADATSLSYDVNESPVIDFHPSILHSDP